MIAIHGITANPDSLGSRFQRVEKLAEATEHAGRGHIHRRLQVQDLHSPLAGLRNQLGIAEAGRRSHPVDLHIGLATAG
jgi:hypothetical protein